MYNSIEIKKLLEQITSIRKTNSNWLDTINYEVREVFFENTYVNNLYIELDMLLKFIFKDPLLFDDINWFIHVWQTGYTITVDDKVYKIETLDDYIEYLKAEGLVS